MALGVIYTGNADMPRDTLPDETQALFVTVVTRSIIDPDEPPRRDQINYHSDRARKWLIKHTYWALHNGYTINASATEKE